jgi:septum formation protein
MSDTNDSRTADRLPGRIILASASPRRLELLAQIGIEVDVVPAHIDEESIRHDDPVTLAVELARAKATAVLERLARESPDAAAGGEPVPLLAADTVVAVAGEILEKPADRADARRMLELLSGRTHQVITGIALSFMASSPANHIDPLPMVTGSCESHVTFSHLSPEAIDDYLDSGEWEGVAGGYRIQGRAARYIVHLSGSYSNVVGLPLHLVYSILTGSRSDPADYYP